MNPHVLIISREILQDAVRHVGIGPVVETKLRSGAVALTSIALNDVAESYGLILHLARLYTERGEDGYAIAQELARHLEDEWTFQGEPYLCFLNVRLED